MTGDPAYCLVLNCGSSSVKFAVYDLGDESRAGQGALTGIGTSPVLKYTGPLFAGMEATAPTFAGGCRSTSEGVHALVDWLETCWPQDALKAVGHRVVHGGDFPCAQRVTPDLMEHLRDLTPLAPLHQPYNLEAIDLLARLHPSVPQVACFDTMFHATIPPLHRRFAIPRAWHDRGVRRYGFHGLSYAYIAGRLQALSPRAFAGKTLVAHLGNGASLCALKGGHSFDTSMGFSAIDGLVMGTRSGSLDAGAVLYFLLQAQMDAAAVEKMLWRESGLLGVSGVSSDMAALLKSPSPYAHEAINLFCLRVIREAGALISLMGGVDAVVFTGGMGEHATAIRTQIGEGLHWVGLTVDSSMNKAASDGREARITSAASRVEGWVIPTDEEIIIARQTRESLAS